MSNRSITGYHLNTFTIRISLHFSSAREFQMGNFQKYWSQNVGQDFIVLDFFVGGRLCGRKRCVREINVSRAGDPVHAGDKALMRENPAQKGRVNRYDIHWIWFYWIAEISNFENFISILNKRVFWLTWSYPINLTILFVDFACHLLFYVTNIFTRFLV